MKALLLLTFVFVEVVYTRADEWEREREGVDTRPTEINPRILRVLENWNLQKKRIENWTKSGQPFPPRQIEVETYVIENEEIRKANILKIVLKVVCGIIALCFVVGICKHKLSSVPEETTADLPPNSNLPELTSYPPQKILDQLQEMLDPPQQVPDPLQQTPSPSEQMSFTEQPPPYIPQQTPYTTEQSSFPTQSIPYPVQTTPNPTDRGRNIRN